MADQNTFSSSYKPTWCPGCGNFGIYPATKKALAECGLDPHNVVMTFGIGCSSNGANFFNCYSFHTIHGRSLPVAMGVKLANSNLTVIADSGDGDGYGEGVSHFVHVARSNIDITYLVHDNRLYSLTKGQVSPTSAEGTKTKSTPFGSTNKPFNPLAAAIVNGATFVAQGFSGDINGLTEIIKKAIVHKGFAVINILQICVTFNKVNTFQWYKERICQVDGTNHDPTDRQRALALVTHDSDKLPTGILYQAEQPTMEDKVEYGHDKPLVEQTIESIDISESLQAYQ